jgi:hypothetical protein
MNAVFDPVWHEIVRRDHEFPRVGNSTRSARIEVRVFRKRIDCCDNALHRFPRRQRILFCDVIADGIKIGERSSQPLSRSSLPISLVFCSPGRR